MLRLENISKRFGEKVILDGFSYTFEATGVYIIRGTSGIGKTTLLRLISGLDTDYTGRITGGGLKNVSVAFQEHRLFPELTLAENVFVTCATDDDKSKASSLLSELGFSPEDLILKPSQLSGGMRQRASLVRAFAKKAPILLLDEPTKELDERLVKKIIRLIVNEARERTVIIVSHDELGSIENATEISL